MHDEGLEPLTEQELQELEERALDRRIVEALEAAPDLSALVPADFAARVAAKVPAKRAVVARSTSYGRRVMWFLLPVLLMAIAFVAPQTAGQSVAMLTIEGLLLVQFLAIVAWLSIRSWRES